jgi:hypothetical protein
MMMILAFLSLLVIGARHSFAHENFRVIGTITKHQGSMIDVKSKDAKTTSIRLDKQTAITRDKKKVDVSELKVGSTVVVDAYGDSEADLLALEIRIVPAIAGSTK